jgi:hypothetical protein
VVEFGAGLAEINLVSGQATTHQRPSEGTWTIVPRNPHMMAKVERGSGDAPTTTVTFHDVWKGTAINTVTAQVNTTDLQLDLEDTWINDEGSVGAAVFSPTSSTPTDRLEYVIVVFNKDGVTFLKRVKPKIDVDIYIRPHPDSGLIVYLRGNGIAFPPSTSEEFTDENYITYSAAGYRVLLDLEPRGPGSGKGRRLIWHSNKYDRLLFSDEFASGALLVKASTGGAVDTIDQSKLDPSKPVRILSASGNNKDLWMVTHTKVGDKNALVLWAMPDMREVSSIEFASSDPATKRLPASTWSVVIPFLSTSTSGNALYAWDAQDVLGVEDQMQPPAHWPAPYQPSTLPTSPCPVGQARWRSPL